MCELDTAHYLANREIEYAEFEFEEVPLVVYAPETGERVATDSMFAGKVRVDEDFNVDWIDIGVKIDRSRPANSIHRQLFDGLETGVMEFIKAQFGEWLMTLPADDDEPSWAERERAIHHRSVL